MALEVRKPKGVSSVRTFLMWCHVARGSPASLPHCYVETRATGNLGNTVISCGVGGVEGNTEKGLPVLGVSTLLPLLRLLPAE